MENRIKIKTWYVPVTKYKLRVLRKPHINEFKTIKKAEEYMKYVETGEALGVRAKYYISPLEKVIRWLKQRLTTKQSA